MVDAATVVWVEGGAGAGSAAPGELALRALDEWATAHGVRLEAPADTAPSTIPIDWAAGDEVERAIARVRDALAGLDFDGAERDLARAEAILREHPELPQAAWLRAEVERAWSSRWLREGDTARAKRAWQRAAGLDGGRAAGLGETAYEAEAPIAASIRMTGEAAALSLRLDGAIVPPGDVRRSPGEHALAIVTADGQATWAEWVTLAQGTRVRIAAPEPPACSVSAMAGARLDADRVRATGVRCGAWVAAAEGANGSIRVATCQDESCGPLTPWRATAPVAGWTALPPATADAHFKWPAWATWTLAGVTVAGASVAIAAAAGAFKPSAPPPETQFVNGGLVVHSF